MPLVSFSSGQVIKSADVNANWGLCVLTDTSRTITVTHTYTATQTFTGGLSLGAAVTSDLLFTDNTYDIGKTGATRPRDGFFSRNVVVSGTLNVAGTVTINASCVIGSAAFFTADATSGIRFNDSTAARNIMILKDAGQVLLNTGTVGATGVGGIRATGLSLFDAGINLTGSLTMVTAISKIVPGATSISHRNNADNADNLLITDAGVVTLRNDVKMSVNGKGFYGRNAALSTDIALAYVDVSDFINIGTDGNAAGVVVGTTSGGKKVGFFASQGTAKATVSGSRGANAALASLLTVLAAYGLLVDSSS